MNYNDAWGDLPKDFYEEITPITEILPVYYRDKKDNKLGVFHSDGSFGHSACIDTVRIAIDEEKIEHGAVLALIKGGKS
jgi:hypothetical protein